MNPPETQSDSYQQETYFDPEVLDTSEQEFSASLETSGERPGFAVDSPGSLAATPERANLTEKMEPRTPVLSGLERPRPFATEAAAQPDREPALTKTEDHPTISGDEPPGSDWRDQVSAKVKHYKTLKPRKERYPSLQLQFDTVVPWKSDKPSFAAESAIFFASSPADSLPPIADPEPRVTYPASTEATARVLEFPRPGTLPFNRDELAEPVTDRPRIVEAPELLPPPPALGGILMGPSSQPEPKREPGVDMPLQTAQLSRRVFAAAVDGFVVAAALAIFGYMFLRFNSSLPQMRAAGEMSAALLGILWFAYQSAFLIFCGTTPGLRAARMNIARFDGTPAPRTLRRWRVLASLLSCASLGMGYAWCFFDEDQLCWHDRLTRTHLAPRK
jgi:uncharacterized RDD family membrane protein YckC